MHDFATFVSNNYVVYLLFYMCLAATGIYLIADVIIRGRPSQRTVIGEIIWIFQLTFGIALTCFPFYHMLTPYIFKD